MHTQSHLICSDSLTSLGLSVIDSEVYIKFISKLFHIYFTFISHLFHIYRIMISRTSCPSETPHDKYDMGHFVWCIPNENWTFPAPWEILFQFISIYFKIISSKFQKTEKWWKKIKNIKIFQLHHHHHHPVVIRTQIREDPRFRQNRLKVREDLDLAL